MPVTGQELVAKNIVKYTQGFLRTVNDVMKEVEFILDREIEKNINLTDHSLKDLAKLDHPYASRHGPFGKPLHDPYWQVHKQSGSLLSSKFHGTEKAEILGGRLRASAFVGLDSTKAKHALYVVFGTSRMIPRPILTGSKDTIQKQAYELISKKLKFLTFTFKGNSR